jgi:hypothetical protein
VLGGKALGEAMARATVMAVMAVMAERAVEPALLP